jgi:hypothetical protein
VFKALKDSKDRRASMVYKGPLVLEFKELQVPVCKVHRACKELQVPVCKVHRACKAPLV